MAGTSSTQDARVVGPTEEELRSAVQVPLTRGLVSLVSPEDAATVLRYRWYAAETRPGRFYAARNRLLSDPPGAPTKIFLHRQLLGLIAAGPDVMADHVNGDSLCNVRRNLRAATRRENLRNSSKRSACSSQFKGVHWNSVKEQWQAMIRLPERRLHLGYFDDEIEAALAYDEAAREHFGPFARPNFTGIPADLPTDERAEAA